MCIDSNCKCDGFGAPFSLFMRQDFGLWPPFVVSSLSRRNNSEKIWPNYLEFAKTRRNFASDLRIER